MSSLVYIHTRETTLQHISSNLTQHDIVFVLKNTEGENPDLERGYFRLIIFGITVIIPEIIILERKGMWKSITNKRIFKILIIKILN